MKTNPSHVHLEAKELIDYLCEIMGVEMANALMNHVHDNNLLEHLFEIALSPDCFAHKQGDRQKIGFHAAWVLDLYFTHYPDEFDPLILRFCEAFHNTKNESAKRHFCKILNKLLTDAKVSITKEWAERVVEACGDWIMNPKSKIAVRLGAVEIVVKLQGETEIAREILPILMEQMKENASPALWARMRQWRRK